jgi:predicted ATPase
MLKRIRINNCLSFDNFEIELEKVNVLIGKNSTGKSNFCHVLQFLRLSQEVNDLRDAAVRALGLNARFTNIYSKNNKSEFEIECEVPKSIAGGKNGSHRYIYTLILKHDKPGKTYPSMLTVEKEQLDLFDSGGKPIALFNNKCGKVEILSESSMKSGSLNYLKDEIPPFKTMLHEIVDSKEHQLANRFKAFISRILHFDFDMVSLRNHSLIPGITTQIGARGENLSWAIYYLEKQKREYYDGMMSVFRQIDKNIYRIEFNEDLIRNQNVAFPLFFDEHGNSFTSESLSDGTLMFIGYFMISIMADIRFLDNKFHPLYSIEEPENGIHVGLLKLLYKMLCQSNGQYIITSHSPYVIDLFDDNLDGMKVFEKEGNKTVLRKMNKEKINQLLETMPLGEMHFREVLTS